MASIFLYGSKTDAIITDAVLLGRERGDSCPVIYDRRVNRAPPAAGGSCFCQSVFVRPTLTG